MCIIFTWQEERQKCERESDMQNAVAKLFIKGAYKYC